jgi:hypothetical protein
MTHTRLPFALAIAILALGLCPIVPTVAAAEPSGPPAAYVSQVDEDLTIRRVAVLPVIDNVEGIYARPIEAQLISLVKANHRWDYVEANMAGNLPALSDLEEKPEEVQRLGKSIDADAFIVAAASRGPNGISVRLDFFLRKDGKLLAQEILRDHPRFEIADMRAQVSQMLKRLLTKLPYSGLILSRQQNRVTVNLGKSDGLSKDQIITAVQIISVSRHPKFNFLVSSEKEILGRIKILKVDETLSFGTIISEKEKGAIRRLAKVSGLEPVNYPAEELGEGNGEGTDLTKRADNAVSFGNEPKEWLPVRAPSFGQVGLKAGMGLYTSSVNLNSVGALEANSTFYPSLSLNGELWLNPEWTVRAEVSQGVLSTNNPRAGSSPSSLNHSMGRYSLSIGYNFLLRDDFFGPKFQVNTGIMSYRMFVDDSSPTALTTVSYTGYVIGVGGSFPLNEEKLWYAGGLFNLVLGSSLTESPVRSGSDATNTINDFSLFVERKIAVNLRAVGSLDISLYSTSFGGHSTTRSDGKYATSISQSHKMLNAGIVYMF